MAFAGLLVRVYWFLSSQFGVDPRKMLQSLRGVPRYLRDLLRFRASYTGRFELVPCLHDWYEEGGVIRSEYFWQDLLVARMIYEARPEKHVDVGSRVDGFVAHVATFRDIEVFDIRPVSAAIPGVTFTHADLMEPVEGKRNYCDSLSCLHALEHFGLGRYGDPIDPTGFRKGFANMAALLKEKGIFYLSVPLGVERVEFNANRVFDPRSIVQLAKQHAFELLTLVLIRAHGNVETLACDEAQLAKLAKSRYTLGVFVFEKRPAFANTQPI